MLTLLILSACAAPTISYGTLEIRAIDAPPSGVSSIVITTSSVSVHKEGESENTWITVVDEEKTFDLVDIQGAEVFLGEQEIATGNYTQIRLDVTNVMVTLIRRR